jgi:hypothetical protein
MTTNEESSNNIELSGTQISTTPQSPVTENHTLMTKDAIDLPRRLEFPSSRRVSELDKQIPYNLQNSKLINRLFVRLVAKGRTFKDVDFSYSIFESCYLRDCVFDSCIFVGCRFSGTSLYGSTFLGSKFDYALFERTIVTPEILDTECPATENLSAKFARTLRMNFQQIGDTKGVNKAISVELRATEVHLKKAWYSKESYYRKKYRSLQRLKVFGEWLQFRFFDLIWGNGESVGKLLTSVCCIFVFMALVDIRLDGRKSFSSVPSYIDAIIAAPQIFFGVLSPRSYPSLYLTAIVFTRLITLGLLLSILLKRLNRR